MTSKVTVMSFDQYPCSTTTEKKIICAGVLETRLPQNGCLVFKIVILYIKIK